MATPKKTSKPALSDLVAVRKDGETIHISPLTLADHQRLGWVVADVALTLADHQRLGWVVADVALTAEAVDAAETPDEPGE